ncbi:MAG: aldehyde dehydrogenase family protein [Terriglobia bacterium]|nr:aldehyde dehydrogenase family protein [Terriglobia bacterium]
METTKNAAIHYPFWLNGEWISDGKATEIRAPYNGELIGTVSCGSRQHAELALDAAVRAFEQTRRLPSYERQRILATTARLLSERKEEFAQVLARESGKPIKIARFEVERTVFTLQVSSEEATRIGGEVLPLDLLPSTRGRWGIIRRFPVGPVIAIAAFNFPLILAAHKIGPAIAAGCSVILKPPPQDPITTLMLAKLFEEAGTPAGAINVLPLANEDASLLVQDTRARMLTFTGSITVGWELRNIAGRKRVLLELGGNAAAIVHRDADLEYAAQRCATGAFSYAGQSCVSVQRIFVHRDVQETFMQELIAAVQQLRVGDPLDEATDVGPMIRERDAVRALDWVQEAISGGARLLCGGQRKASLLQPTVLTGTSPRMRVNCQEIFAPVVTVEPYGDFESALHQVNDSPFGLQTGLFTRDASLIFRAYEELNVGGVIAGDIPTWRIDHMPYGGVKDSGTGREGVRYTIQEMTEMKLLVMNIA